MIVGQVWKLSIYYMIGEILHVEFETQICTVHMLPYMDTLISICDFLYTTRQKSVKMSYGTSND